MLISHDGCRFPLVINYIKEARDGTVAQVLALPPHSKKVMCSIPAWGAVGSGGQVLPRVHSGLSPGPFCVEFACSPRVHKGFPPLRTPTVKTCKITELMSTPDQRWTDDLTWSPGAAKLPTAPGGSLRKDGPGWEKAETKFTATSGLPACVCVCVLCRLHICTCVFQCVVCAIKNLTKVLIIKL